VRSSVILVHDTDEVERAIETFAREPNGALVLSPDVFFDAHRDLIIGLAVMHRLPVAYSARHYVTSGGLISYDPIIMSFIAKPQATSIVS
jgi:hypothetical protein